MLRVAAAQIAPVFLDPDRTADRCIEALEQAAADSVEVVAFGETLLPGYPFWLALSDGARFDDARQKKAYAAYLSAAVTPDHPAVRRIVEASRDLDRYVVLGMAERGPGPGRGSVYAAAATINRSHGLVTVHRKLVPTYEERLAWAPGDGHGLRCHEAFGVRIGALNCWENWMPQARHALYADGVDLLVSIWPGSVALTHDITRFAAREGRCFTLAAGGLLRLEDLGDFPLRDVIAPAARSHAGSEWILEGGSAIAGPDGMFIVEPQAHTQGLIAATLDPAKVAEERQNFDPTGHYARPDVFDVRVDRRRHLAARFDDDAS